MSFISYLKDGISLGSIYAIIALGYTMVYGIAKMLNFAHGDVIMVGAYIILTCITRGGMSPILAVILSVVICTLLGVVIEKVAYSPLRKASSNLAVLITAIGVSYLLQNLALLIFGADAKSFVAVIKVPSITLFDGELTIKGITMRNHPCMYHHHGGTFPLCKKRQNLAVPCRRFPRTEMRHS